MSKHQKRRRQGLESFCNIRAFYKIIFKSAFIGFKSGIGVLTSGSSAGPSWWAGGVLTKRRTQQMIHVKNIMKTINLICWYNIHASLHWC
jgi:hypothetical protein